MQMFRIIFILLILGLNIYAKELEKVSLQLLWLDQFQFAGYYVAKEKGYYRDAGLDVTIKKFNTNLSTVDEVMSKRATYGIGRSSLIIDRDNGKKVTILFASFQSSPMILLAREDSGIKSMADFKNKRIMLTDDAASAASNYAMGKKFHIHKKDMIVQKHSFNIDDLINRKTDLMASYISNEPFLMEERGVKAIVFDPKDYGFDFYSDFLFTSEDEVIHHEQRTKDFAAASRKGWEHAFQNIDETVELILKKYNTQNKSKEALLYEANSLKKLAYYHIDNDEFGSIKASKVQRIHDIYNIMGYVNNGFDLDKFIFQNTKDRLISLTEKERDYLQSKKEIRMCVIPDRLPFSQIENDLYIGIDAEYMQLLSQQLDFKFSVVETSSWDESLSYMKQGNCDILPLIQKEPQSNDDIQYSDTFFEDSLIVVTKNDKPFISNIEMIVDKKLGILESSSYKKELQSKFPKSVLVDVKNIEEGFAALENDNIYGLLGDLASVAYVLHHNNTNSVKINSSLIKPVMLSVGVRGDDKVLLSILNKSLQTVDVKAKKLIYNKWVNVEYIKKLDYDLILEIVAIFVLIILIIVFFLIRQSLLSKKVKDLNTTLENRVREEVEKNRLKDEQLFAQSRLAQMGEMISMIAHQWRQPLGAISTTVGTMEMKINMGSFNLDTKDGQREQNEFFLKKFTNINGYINSLSTTIDDFRNFYKPNKNSISVKLDVILAKSLKIIESSLFSHGIEIVYFSNESEEVQMYDGEMMQVILNILKNAEDTFVEKVIKKPKITIHVKQKTITIEDNAGGINPEIMEKIFDPYFSTKNEKNGTGLGLYMSKTIVEEHHHGKLSVENIENGARFTIDLNKGSLND